ncbi:MAG TPA: glycosyltransferase, partial [Bacteroidales bacterium]|nr:glycosyltransferase [Bacteroidales bacterium]
MITQKEICGVVVWYNPTTDNVTAINTYLENISHLFIVDNSTTDNSALINTLPNNKITYLPNLENLGIATALNIGCEAALNANAKWILTMDQDSKFDRFSLSDFITEANQCPTFDKVG